MNCYCHQLIMTVIKDNCCKFVTVCLQFNYFIVLMLVVCFRPSDVKIISISVLYVLCKLDVHSSHNHVTVPAHHHVPVRRRPCKAERRRTPDHLDKWTRISNWCPTLRKHMRLSCRCWRLVMCWWFGRQLLWQWWTTTNVRCWRQRFVGSRPTLWRLMPTITSTKHPILRTSSFVLVV